MASIWRQKYKFFHRQAKAWLWKNKIKEITREDGTNITYYDQVKAKKKSTLKGYSLRRERWISTPKKDFLIIFLL
jgi:hypothetical protein